MAIKRLTKLPNESICAITNLPRPIYQLYSGFPENQYTFFCRSWPSGYVCLSPYPTFNTPWNYNTIATSERTTFVYYQDKCPVCHLMFRYSSLAAPFSSLNLNPIMNSQISPFHQGLLVQIRKVLKVFDTKRFIFEIS